MKPAFISLVFAFTSSACHSGLYRAVDVLRDGGAVAPGMALLTPVSASSPLGVSVKAEETPEAVELAAERCFVIKESPTKSLDTIVFTDRSARSLNSLVGVANVTSAGVDLERTTYTRGDLRDVELVSGTGVFDGNRCAPTPGKKYRIVTSALRGRLHVTTVATWKVEPNVTVPIPNTPVEVRVEAGASGRRTGTFSTSSLVYFTAASSLVTVEQSSTADEAIPPAMSKTVSFPQGFSGEVVFEPFDSGNMTASFILHANGSVPEDAPSGWSGVLCKPGERMTLGIGKSCHLWFSNADIIVKVSTKDGYPVARIDAFRTNLTQ